jgi:hypothetical protein
MKDRLNHNLNQVIKTKDGELKVSDSHIQSNAHVDLWIKTHPQLIGFDLDYLPKNISLTAREKSSSYECGFNRALELVKSGIIDITTVKVNTNLDPSFSGTGVILESN